MRQLIAVCYLQFGFICMSGILLSTFIIERQKHLKFETEGQEFAKKLRSLEQSVPRVKVQDNFW